MEAVNKFYRSFLIFSQEDMGFGSKGTPSGYVKIEARDGKGKLQVSVQNLIEDKDGMNYKVYILKCDEKLVYPICAGTIPYQRNKGELHWDFNPKSVGNAGIPIEEFNVAVVVAENQKSSNKTIVCPLVAYKDKKLQWKDKLNSILYNSVNKMAEDEGDVIKKHEVVSKYEVVVESKFTKADLAPDLNMPSAEDNYTKTEESITGNMIHVPQIIPDAAQEKITPEVEEETKPQEDILTNDIKGENSPETYGNEGMGPVEDDNALKVPGFSNGQVKIDELSVDEFKVESPITMDSNPTMKAGPCYNMNNPYCIQQANGNVPNTCANCNVKIFTKDAPTQDRVSNEKAAAANMERFRKSLDLYFEVNDPFGSNRKDYSWWRVNSPVQLNNIFYQCNIKTPLFFNPAVMMAHYKYRYLIVGIYSDRGRGREYIVCGIPGVYGIDDKPFGDMCRWVQVEGSRPRYGAFGYWLVYMDSKTGKFLGLN